MGRIHRSVSIAVPRAGIAVLGENRLRLHRDLPAVSVPFDVRKTRGGRCAVNTNTVIIRTPEGIEFPLLLANPVTRALAYSVDLAVISVVATVIANLAAVFALISLDFALALVFLTYT